ncbi:Hypothetical protein PHPALM_2975, partial [Phytophthora palmivora]
MARTPPTLGQLKGRTRISGTGKPLKKFKRVAISYAYKLSVVEFYDAVVSKDKMHLTVKHFYPELLPTQIPSKKRQIYNWLDQRELLVEKCEIGCGSHCNDRSLDYIPVNGTMVRMQAEESYP